MIMALMRVRLLLIAFFVAIGVGKGVASLQDDYYGKVDEADKACREERWEDAVRYLKEAMMLDPDNAGNIMLLSNLGMVQYRLGEDSLAISTLTEAHKIAPSSVTILSNRAHILMETGYDGEAYEDYGLIMQLDSTDVTSRLRHGIIALRARDIETARQDFEYIAKRFPSTSEAMVGMATLHCALGEYKEALPYYNELLRNSRDIESLTGRALCNLMTDNLQEASDDIAEALQLSPEDGELYLYRAALNKMRFRPDDADADARRAVSLGVDPARARQFLKDGVADGRKRR